MRTRWVSAHTPHLRYHWTVDAHPANGLQFRLLGPLEVRLDGVVLPIATRRQRALLVLLLLSTGRVVPAERLIDQLWDGNPPPQAAVTLRSYVSNLRRALGGRDGAASVLVTRGQGYSIEVPGEAIDSVRLHRLVEQGREHLRGGRHQAAFESFDAAVESWAGDPLAEVADHEAVQGLITQLTETYLGAVEGRFEALLVTGRHLDAIGGLEAFVREQPLREEPHALLVLALHRAGRTADALDVYRRLRARLRDELGIDPSPRLDQLHQQVLEQDPALAAPSPPVTQVPTAPPSRSPSVSTPDAAVVGRERELRVLRRHLDRVVEGAGSLVLLAGEPGIGKTTVLDALEGEARQRGVATHAGRAPAATGAPSFWTWGQVLDSLAADLDDDRLRHALSGSARPVGQISASVAARTGQAHPVTGDSPQQMRFLLYEAVSTFVGQATSERPVLITLDDLHWADVPSLELLSYLTPTLATRPVMLVAAYRDLEADRTDALEATLATVSREEAVEELALAGLTHDDVGLMVGDLADGSDERTARDQFVTVLHERTGGNPFFVRQLSRLLLDAAPTGELTEELTASPVPRGVSHVIAQRLKGLPTHVEDFLAAAAVLGREFDLPAAAGVAELDLDAALEAFDEAARHGLVESRAAESAPPRFVHALVQEVVLDRVATGRAVRLHARAAAHLQTQPGTGPDELAEHLWAARDVVGASAVPALSSAAAAAASVFSYERAETHLRRALQLIRTAGTSDPATELPVLLALFQLIAAERGWGDEDGRALVDRAMQLAGPAGCTDDNVRLWWSMFFFLLDRFDQAAYVELARTLLDSLRETIDAPGSDRPPAADATWAAVHLMSLFTALASDDREAAGAHLQTARQHIEAAPNDDLVSFDEHLHVMLLVIESAWAALNGHAQAYEEAVQGAVALADADGRPFPRAVARSLGAACAPYVEGDARFVLDLADNALELDRRFGFSWLETVADCIRLWAAARAGVPAPDATAVLGERLQEIGAQGRRGTESVLLLLLADVHALEGRFDLARSCLLRVREVPGPYLGMVVDLVDSKLADLETAS